MRRAQKDLRLPRRDATRLIQRYGERALRLLEGAAGDVDVLVPGHGSIGGADLLRARIDQDRVYVQALHATGAADDPRVGPSATFDWMSSVQEWQLQRLVRRSERDGTPG